MMYRDAIIFIQGTLWNWTIPEVSKRQKIQELLWMFKRTPAQLDCLHLGHSTTGHRSVSTAFWDTVPITSYPHRKDNKVPSSKRSMCLSFHSRLYTLARRMAHASSAKPFSSMFRAFGHGAKFEVDYWRVPRCSKSQALFNPISSYFNNQIGSWVTHGFIRVSSKKGSESQVLRLQLPGL